MIVAAYLKIHGWAFCYIWEQLLASNRYMTLIAIQI